MREREPWTIHPDLGRDRLIEVARLIAHGRNDALDRHDPNVGDNSWTLGCSAFQFQRFRISAACAGGALPWLSLIDPSMQFVFKIGSVPMRFYAGPAEEPNSRTLYQSYPELHQLSLFSRETEARAYTHRIAVETDIEGAVTAIKYVALDNDEPVFFWDIPLTAAVRTIHEVGTPLAEGVELPPPAIVVTGEDEDADAEKRPA